MKLHLNYQELIRIIKVDLNFQIQFELYEG